MSAEGFILHDVVSHERLRFSRMASTVHVVWCEWMEYLLSDASLRLWLASNTPDGPFFIPLPPPLGCRILVCGTTSDRRRDAFVRCVKVLAAAPNAAVVVLCDPDEASARAAMRAALECIPGAVLDIREDVTTYTPPAYVDRRRIAHLLAVIPTLRADVATSSGRLTLNVLVCEVDDDCLGSHNVGCFQRVWDGGCCLAYRTAVEQWQWASQIGALLAPSARVLLSARLAPSTEPRAVAHGTAAALDAMRDAWGTAVRPRACAVHVVSSASEHASSDDEISDSDDEPACAWQLALVASTSEPAGGFFRPPSCPCCS